MCEITGKQCKVLHEDNVKLLHKIELITFAKDDEKVIYTGLPNYVWYTKTCSSICVSSGREKILIEYISTCTFSSYLWNSDLTYRNRIWPIGLAFLNLLYKNFSMHAYA